MAFSFIPSIQVPGAGRSPWVTDQTALHSDEVNQSQPEQFSETGLKNNTKEKDKREATDYIELMFPKG